MLNLLVDLTQRMLGERLAYVDELQCTVLEVKVRHHNPQRIVVVAAVAAVVFHDIAPRG